MPGIGGRTGYEPVATIALVNVTSSAPSTAIVFGPVNVPVALDPLDAVRLEERRDAAGHLIDDARPSTTATVPKSSVGSPTCTPSFANVSRASW